ncbi:MAG: hypothetical protein K1X89_25080 [Myxococcaceae bacterium]|nr:hypothetical protein [Myxococcaceae bacterium]
MDPRAPRQALQVSRRFAALMTGVLLVAGQLSSLAHFALVRHARCAEHGELVHAQGEGALTSAAPRASPGPAVQARALAEESHGHDHCVLGIARRSGALIPVQPALTLTAPHDAGVMTAPVSHPAGPSVALLRLAPKSSPPA